MANSLNLNHYSYLYFERVSLKNYLRREQFEELLKMGKERYYLGSKRKDRKLEMK